MESQIKTILVPVDFSEYSKQALKYAYCMAKDYQAKLFILYVIEPVVYPADFSMGQFALPSIDSEISIKASEELESLAKDELGCDINCTTLVKIGKPFVEINETASEIDADLIIIASHGHTGVEHILFGSTAEKVVRKAPCPVLTLRSPLKGFKYKGEQ
ncbi:MAG: universal stress protein [Bacteroidota bacterium]|nr:universal stress protein [Bacteroidota bacterium]MDP4190842.1 universal stress protein [Bacteroidota bacterium]MDP4193879.1 universal stress protein [Bacteroidota bacterium]